MRVKSNKQLATRVIRKIRLRYQLSAVCLLLLAECLLLSCSVPNLEEPDCGEARGIVREFYSYHFGNNLGFSEEELNARGHYLTPEFRKSLGAAPQDLPPGIDPFTRAADPPKAFRVGECKVVEAGRRTSFEVLLFWRDDVRSEQRSITVEADRRADRWLIDRVSN